MTFSRPSIVTFPDGCQSYLWLELNLICQHKNLEMVLLCIIRSCFYLYLWCVMVMEHHLVLRMSLIVILGAWSLVGIMRFGMLLVTFLLWFDNQLLI